MSGLPGKKISELTAMTALAAADIIPVYDLSITATRGITVEDLFQQIPVDVGLGIAAPDGTLHVHTATAGAVTAHTNADDLVVENSDHGGISILTPNDKIGALYFGDENDHDIGRITYTHSQDIMDFLVANTNVIRLYSGGFRTFQPFYMLERANAGADTAGYGQLWVKNTAPCELWFTDDAGLDTQIV